MRRAEELRLSTDSLVWIYLSNPLFTFQKLPQMELDSRVLEINDHGNIDKNLLDDEQRKQFWMKAYGHEQVLLLPSEQSRGEVRLSVSVIKGKCNVGSSSPYV